MRTQTLARVGTVLVVSALMAGCSARRPLTPPPSPGQGEGPRVVTVVLREFEFEPKPLKAKAGMVRFVLMNRGTVDHDFAIPSLSEHGNHEQHLVAPGKTRTLDLELKPGTYEAVCTVPGHRSAGMWVPIEVNP
jgi:uncharacterized cupredoxin-like copper-binding protein